MGVHRGVQKWLFVRVSRGARNPRSPRYWMNARPRSYERDDCWAGRSTFPGLTGVRGAQGLASLDP